MKTYAFTARMEHSKKTVVRLNQVLHRISHRWMRVLCGALGLILLFLGVSGGYSTVVSTVMAAIGCWCFLLVDYPAREKTRTMEAQLKGCYPVIDYRFADDRVDMQIKDQRESVEYRHIVRWASDSNYIYFFPTENSIFMIDQHTLRPGDFEAFQSFIRQRCSARWSYPGNINYPEILRKIKRLRAKGEK